MTKKPMALCVCNRRAFFERDGAFYCKHHDPETRRERGLRASARRDQKSKRELARREHLKKVEAARQSLIDVVRRLVDTTDVSLEIAIAMRDLEQVEREGSALCP
jgi:hypothetical protein